jgi:inositol transport system permease protein
MTQTKPFLSTMLREQSQVLIFIFLLIVFSAISPEFRTVGNFINLLKQITVIGVISCGMTMVIITGCLDLSVGSAFSLLGLVSIIFQRNNNVLGIAMPVMAAVVIGLFNGFIVTRYKINSIIATLGTLSILSGIALLITNGAIISGRTGTWFGIIGGGRFLGVPNHVYVLIAIMAIFHIVLSRTTFGRKVKYVGTNATAAEIAGMRPARVRTSAFVMSSLSVSVAVIIYTSRMTTASPIAGLGYEFDAITAVVIGGTSLAGGKGSIFKTIIGVLLLATIVNILTLFNVPFSYQSIMKGVLIITAIYVDIRARRQGEN